MITRHLFELYNKLISFSHDHVYTALEIPGHEGIFIAVDRDTHPSLFITAEIRILEPPSKTAYVSLLPNQSYRITLRKGVVVEGIFHVITCSSTNQSDINTFLSLIEAFIGQNITCQTACLNVSTFFRSLVRLFSAQPARDKASERLGLWGELFVMRLIRGYSFWAPYWHTELTDIFDFSATNKRLEVKTSASGQRIHHITHSQVFPMGKEDVVFASLVLRDDQTGLSLKELIEECKTVLLGSMSYFKIEKAARHAGMHNTDDLGPRYSLKSAVDSLAFFSSEDIPHFSIPEPPGVSQTNFRADLSNATRIEMEKFDSWLDTWLSNKEDLK